MSNLKSMNISFGLLAYSGCRAKVLAFMLSGEGSMWHRYRKHQELPAEDIATMEKKIWPTIPKGSRTGLIVVLPYSCEFGVAAGRKGLG